MAVNPLINLGSLNRIRGQVVFVSYPSLNVTASYLGKRGISMDPTGDLTQMIEAMTGLVPSPEPYLAVDVTISLLKTNALASTWITQIQTTTLLGTMTVHPDTSQYPDFTFLQASVMRMPRESFAGDDPTADFVIRGYYPINTSLWDLA